MSIEYYMMTIVDELHYIWSFHVITLLISGLHFGLSASTWTSLIAIPSWFSLRKPHPKCIPIAMHCYCWTKALTKITITPIASPVFCSILFCSTKMWTATFSLYFIYCVYQLYKRESVQKSFHCQEQNHISVLNL